MIMRVVVIHLEKEFGNKANAESALEFIQDEAEERGWRVTYDIRG